MDVVAFISNIVTIISAVITCINYIFQWIIKGTWKSEDKRHTINPFLPDIELGDKASSIGKRKKKLLIFICKVSLLVFLCSATLSIFLYLVRSKPPEDEHEA